MELPFSERIFSITIYLQQQIVLYVDLYYKQPCMPLFYAAVVTICRFTISPYLFTSQILDIYYTYSSHT
jgi:hypothetical protein